MCAHKQFSVCSVCAPKLTMLQLGCSPMMVGFAHLLTLFAYTQDALHLGQRMEQSADRATHLIKKYLG